MTCTGFLGQLCNLHPWKFWRMKDFFHMCKEKVQLTVTCQKTCLRFIPDLFSESKFVFVQTYLIQSHALVSVLLSQLLTSVNTALGEKQTKKRNKQHCFPVPLSLLKCSAKCSYLERKNKIRQHRFLNSDLGIKEKKEPGILHIVFKIPSCPLWDTFIDSTMKLSTVL